MNHDEHCAALEFEIERFADVLAGADPRARVPSCPQWSVDDLAGHLGYVHRWAEGLVRVRAAQRVSGADMDLDLTSTSPTWLREGGSTLVATLRASDPDAPMWSWGRDQHVRFWSRRQLHETLVHRVDLELALGSSPTVEADVALDAIDEFLENLSAAGRFSPRVRELRGHGEVVSFRALDASRAWHVRLDDDGFALVDEAVAPDVQFLGAASDLLAVVYRRRNLDESNVEVRGDRALAEFWLARSALE